MFAAPSVDHRISYNIFNQVVALNVQNQSKSSRLPDELLLVEVIQGSLFSQNVSKPSP